MDRSFQKDYDWLIARQKTAYQILEIDQNKASQDIIKKAYRQKALVYHPDKNKSHNAEEMFREVIVSYSILSNLKLKEQYDEYLKHKSNISNSVYSNNIKQNPQNKQKNEKIAKFKADLREKEEEYKKKQTEILKKQQNAEFNKQNFDNISNHHDFKTSITKKDNQKLITIPTKTFVKWKNKKSVQFDNELIKRLMEVFGPVEFVSILDNDTNDNYHYANVTFKTPVGATLAASHDYSTTADYWDSINLRKISSLLRSVELVDDKINWSKINISTLSPLDYIAYNMLINE